MKQKLLTLVGLTTVLVSSSYSAAHAFTWNVNATVISDDLTGNLPPGQPSNPFTVSGSFTVDDESLGTAASITGINITVTNQNLVTDVISFNIPGPLPGANITAGGGGITDISIDSTAGCPGTCNLNLSFASAITTAGGTVAFDPLFATITNTTNAGSGFGANGLNGNVSVAKVVPFNFSTTPGLVVLGLIVGVGKGRKHLPKVKKKIADLLAK